MGNYTLSLFPGPKEFFNEQKIYVTSRMLKPYTFWFPGMSNEPWSNFILVDRGLKYELAHFHLRQMGWKFCYTYEHIEYSVKYWKPRLWSCW